MARRQSGLWSSSRLHYAWLHSPMLRRLLIAVIVIGLATAGVLYLTRTQPVAVLAHEIGRGDVEATVANTRAGTVNAHRRAKLAPSTGGQVDALSVRAGDRVVAQQVLLELWNHDLRAQLALAESEVERAVALLAQARERGALAEREAQRALELQQQGIAAEERVDRAVSEARATAAALQAAGAEVQVRRDQVRTIQAQLDRTILRAPFAGVVAEVNAEIGEFVTPSPVGIPTPPAVDLIDDSSLYVTAPIDEVDAAQVQPGMPVRVTLDAFRDRHLAGRVRRVAPYVLDREKQARTVDIEVDLASLPEGIVLLPGYSADVEVLLQRRADVVRVPAEALRDGGRVMLLGDDGVLAERTVRVGLSNWRFAEVLSGLTPGERVVLSLDRAGVVPGAAARVETPSVTDPP